jgi:hypothetical protein
MSCRRESDRNHGSFRTETGLAPKDRDRWYRAGGRSPQDRAVCRRSRRNGCSRPNTSPSAGPHKAFGSDEPESTCKQGIFLGTAEDRPAASPESVRPDADAQADCAHAKGLQIQAFLRAAEGIRTLDLLHGKQDLCFLFAADIACKNTGSRMRVACCDSPAFTGSSRGFRHPMGTQQPDGVLPSVVELEHQGVHSARDVRRGLP